MSKVHMGPTITDILVKHFVSNHNSNSVFITTNGYFEKNFHFLIIFGQGNYDQGSN